MPLSFMEGFALLNQAFVLEAVRLFLPIRFVVKVVATTSISHVID
jgi:hypothetical protein